MEHNTRYGIYKVSIGNTITLSINQYQLTLTKQQLKSHSFLNLKQAYALFRTPPSSITLGETAIIKYIIDQLDEEIIFELPVNLSLKLHTLEKQLIDKENQLVELIKDVEEKRDNQHANVMNRLVHTRFKVDVEHYLLVEDAYEFALDHLPEYAELIRKPPVDLSNNAVILCFNLTYLHITKYLRFIDSKYGILAEKTDASFKYVILSELNIPFNEVFHSGKYVAQILLT